MHRETRCMDTPKHLPFPENNQPPDYLIVNPHKTVKHGTWVPKNLFFPKNDQHVDYPLVNPHKALKQGAWVPGAFTPEFAQVFPHQKT